MTNQLSNRQVLVEASDVRDVLYDARDKLGSMAGLAEMCEDRTSHAAANWLYNQILDLIQGIDARLEGVTA